MGRVLLHVGMGETGPGIANTIPGREVLIVLNIGGYPEGDPSVVGPLDDRTVNNGAVVHAMGR
jgi:hypothetical protein